jgi:hypothetical protein
MTAIGADPPSTRYEGFFVYDNPDGTYHILVIAGGGRYILADKFNCREEAEWCASLLNLVIVNPEGAA